MDDLMMEGDLLFHHAKNSPQNLFLKDDSREITYAQAESEVSRLSTSLFGYLKKNLLEKKKSSHGYDFIFEPITISLYFHSGIDYIFTILAGVKIRKVYSVDIRFLPLNVYKPPALLNKEIDRAKSDLLIYDSPHSFTSNIPSFSFKEWQSISQRNTFQKKMRTNTWVMEKPFIYLFTSGSSGKSKIAVFSQKNWMESARSGDRFFPFRKKDRWLNLLPLYHVSGMSILFRALLHGAAVVFTQESRDHWPEIFKSYAITHISLVSSQIVRIPPTNFSSLKYALVGGGPIPSFLHNHLYPQTPLRPTYGLTEAMSHIAVYDGSGSKGKEVFLKILLDKKIRIKKGEILIHRDNLCLGYWEVELKTWKGEWFATGDLGEIKGDTLCIQGRKDRQFISGGENIQPEEIEQVLLSYPKTSIFRACVFPISHPHWGKIPYAALDWEGGDIFNLRDYLSDYLESYKIPYKFFLLPVLNTKFRSSKLSYQDIIEEHRLNRLISLDS